jgi:hypothetical protein
VRYESPFSGFPFLFGSSFFPFLRARSVTDGGVSLSGFPFIVRGSFYFWLETNAFITRLKDLSFTFRSKARPLGPPKGRRMGLKRIKILFTLFKSVGVT